MLQLHKILWFLLFVTVFLLLQAHQLDQELAVRTLFRAKSALNHAVHAAAQQVDATKLAKGSRVIDPDRARDIAMLYLRENLLLDENNRPRPGTFLHAQVEILEFEVINEEDVSFPYIYHNPHYDYKVTLQRPGVIAIVRVDYPRIYSLLAPIFWEVKATSQLVHL